MFARDIDGKNSRHRKLNKKQNQKYPHNTKQKIAEYFQLLHIFLSSTTLVNSNFLSLCVKYVTLHLQNKINWVAHTKDSRSPVPVDKAQYLHTCTERFAAGTNCVLPLCLFPLQVEVQFINCWIVRSVASRCIQNSPERHKASL